MTFCSQKTTYSVYTHMLLVGHILLIYYAVQMNDCLYPCEACAHTTG